MFGDKSDRVIEAVGRVDDGQAFEVGYYNGDAKQKAIINISPATGCPVGCNFCELIDKGGNLPAAAMYQQVVDMLEIASELDGYDIGAQPLKINIAKTGEPVLNPKMIDAMYMILDKYPDASFKYSTTLPDIKHLNSRIRDLAIFAANHTAGTTQLQISLLSTNDAYRQASVVERSKIKLASISKVRDAIDVWREEKSVGANA